MNIKAYFRPKWRRLCLLIFARRFKTRVMNMGYWQSLIGQDGWILAKFFSACLGTKMEARSVNTQKKEGSRYPAILTEQAWSRKDLLYGFRENLSCGTRRRVVPSGQDSSILPAHGASQMIISVVSQFIREIFGHVTYIHTYINFIYSRI